MNQLSDPHNSQKPIVFTSKDLLAESDWKLAAEVIKAALRPSLDISNFLSRRRQLIEDGYRLAGIFLGNTLASVASYTISPHAELGRELLIHDMATVPALERQGLAGTLITQLEAIALEEKCGRVFVHTRKMSAFYLKNGFVERSTGLVKLLPGSS